MNQLTWTESLPTQPGYYWAKTPGAKARVREVARYAGDGELWVVETDSPLRVYAKLGALWAGPIECPGEKP